MSLLLLLQSAQRRTARDLAQTLEVSQRTIYRDVDALSAAGVPVYADRGPEGGISLAAGYRRALTHFGDEEIRALFVSNSAVLADLGLGVGLDRALDKVRGALSDVQRRAAEKARGRIHVDQRRWNQSDPPREKLALLHRAVWEERKVALEYEDRKGAATERIIEPFGLVSKAGVWYVVARTGEGFRSFRVERIRNATELTERFERPADFDLDEHWRASTSKVEADQMRAYVTIVRATKDSIDEVCGYWPYERVHEDDPLTVRLRFSTQGAALRHALVWGIEVEILEPAELRDALVAEAQRIVRRYTPN